jgi:hypothetical protein
MIKRWTDIIGPAFGYAWRTIDILKRRQEAWRETLRGISVARDEAAGVVYTASQRKAWTFDDTKCKDIDTALNFLAMVGDDNFHILIGPHGNSLSGAMIPPRCNEDSPSYALRVHSINGTSTMIPIVDLKEGDYLGTVPGLLHYFGDTGHNHKLCFAGSAGVMLELLPSPLWPVISSRKLQRGNVVVMWQTVGNPHKAELHDIVTFKFILFVSGLSALSNPWSSTKPIWLEGTKVLVQQDL